MSVPQSNSTQTTAMPTAVAERTRRTPEAPLMDASIGNVTIDSISSGAIPWPSVRIVTVACRDLDEAAREPLAADLHEHVRTSGFHQHGGLWCSGQSSTTTGVQNCRTRLTNEQLTIRVLHFHLHRQGFRCRIERTRIVYMMEAQHDRFCATGNFQCERGQAA